MKLKILSPLAFVAVCYLGTSYAQQETLVSDLASQLKNQGSNINYNPFISPLPAVNGKPIISLNGELGISDGTESGTEILKDINNNPSQQSNPFIIGTLGTTTFFAGNDGVHGYELWKTDGTTNGTVMVKDIVPGSDESLPIFLNSVRSFASLNGLLVFAVYKANQAGFDLWKTDGTEAGTTLIKEMPTSGFVTLRNFVVHQNKLYYTVRDGGLNEQEIWRSDGTNAGTYPVFTCSIPSAGQNIDILTPIAMGDAIYFNGSDADNGQELYKIDVATDEVSLVSDIDVGINYSRPTNLTVSNGQLYFLANNGSGIHLYKTNGTNAGTVKVKDAVFGVLIDYKNQLFFSDTEAGTGLALWSTDGTTTQIVKDIPEAPGSQLSDFFVSNNTLIFYAQTTAEGRELWRSDGTEAGTTILKDIRPGTLSGIPFTTINKVVLNTNNTIFLFGADDGINGYELWKSDGTPQNTVLINANRDLEFNAFGESVALNNSLFFIANTGVNGRQLHYTDGNSPVTIPKILPDDNQFIGKLTAVGNTLFFSANQAATGYELWKSDGTTNGTQLVKDIKAGALGGSIGLMTTINNKIYFSADDGVNGPELWQSDGTEAGTTLIKDIVPGTSGSSLNYLTRSGNQIYFSANSVAEGIELWKSDGTTSGTVLVKDVFPGPTGSQPFLLAPTTSGKYQYFTANTESKGYELWRTDANNVTIEIKDIRPGSESSNIFGLAEMGDHYYFSANEGTNGAELWRTNGDVGNAELVKDINPGVGSSFIGNVLAVNDVLYFSASNGSLGQELWKSDGTNGGTILLKDIVQGAFDSYPSDFIQHNNLLYFTAGDGFQRELWKSDGTTDGTVKVTLNNLSEGEWVRKLVYANNNLFYVFTTYGKIIKIVSTNDVVSVEDTIDNSISFFPNPVNELLTIDVKAFNEGHLKIININGKTIEEMKLQNGVQTIDVRKLQSGLYIFSIKHKKGLHNHRVIIKR